MTKQRETTKKRIAREQAAKREGHRTELDDIFGDTGMTVTLNSQAVQFPDGSVIEILRGMDRWVNARIQSIQDAKQRRATVAEWESVIRAAWARAEERT